ncbi:MAG: toprim domain-containing protein [Pseudomonadota bacterium]
MENSPSDLAQRLSREAETVCRHYLSNGRKQGRYWIVGDVENAPGRSLYVRLTGPPAGKGAAGKWTDAATGEHGDLLDLIAANLRLATLGEALDEARRFLSLPRPEPPKLEPLAKAPTGSPEAARRLWSMGKPIAGTLAERYLAGRGITGCRAVSALRFHPNCYYWREDRADAGRREAWPALLAKVTDADGNITGLHRTWLDPVAAGKAPIDPNRKAMGNLLGHGVRMGEAADILAAGEGLETMLSLRMALPDLPVIAALSTNHLAALELPHGTDRLYIAADSDEAGRIAADKLGDRARSKGIETMPLAFRLEDANEDLRAFGLDDLRAHLRPQLAPQDVERLLPSSAA